LSTYKPRKKTFFVFLIILPIISALLLGEIYVRLFKEYMTPEILKTKSLQYSPSIFSRFIFPEKKQRTEAAGRIASYVINSKGYRGKEFSIKKNKGTIRIIIYGGSATFDIYEPEGKDWPHRIEQMLKEKGILNIEVINAGIPGLTSVDCVGRIFADGWSLEPDYLIICEAWNDICYFPNKTTMQKFCGPYNENDDPRISYQSSLDKILCELSQLYVRLRGRYYDWKYNIGLEGASKRIESDQEINELGLRQYKLSLEMLVDLARNIHSTPILVTQPRLVSKNNTDEEKLRIGYKYVRLNHSNIAKAFELTDEIIKDVSKSKYVHMIDPSKELSGKSEYFYDQVHTTDEGSYQLAKIVSEDLYDLIKNNLKQMKGN
jgi:lysophospholipase L1-like esterase